jgi:hypothetical protein
VGALAVAAAAYEWWTMRRPASFSEADHQANPTINTVTDSERALALAVAGTLVSVMP